MTALESCIAELRAKLPRAGKLAMSRHILRCAMAWRREHDLPKIDRVEAEVQALRPNARVLLAVLKEHMRRTRAEHRRVPHNSATFHRLQNIRIALAAEGLRLRQTIRKAA